ncbi:MAG TPA: hypothetical protein DEQ03_00790 [Marinilabiliales bacterium]|nr:hypothetical protein [Marinilabiliales bacterium]
MLSACLSPKSKKEEALQKESLEKEQSLVLFDEADYKKDEIVFFNLFSPVDFTYLVTENNAYYNSLLINPIDNITKYNQSTKIALNLGVYGADISYLWMFNQSQQALSYRTAIQRLTDQLEIPVEFVEFTFETAETHSNKFDTLVILARKTYQSADTFLKESGREHSAGLILLGGWLETMFIATNMYEKPDALLMGRIAIQKFSINSLYQILQKHQENIEISEYLVLLRKLKKVYDENTVLFPAECMMIDTVAKQIRLINPPPQSLTHDQYKEIQRITAQIRNHIIN